MKKRILSILLCLALCCALLPATASAETWSYGSQLSGNAKILYDTMVNSPEIMQAGMFTGTTGIGVFAAAYGSELLNKAF